MATYYKGDEFKKNVNPGQWYAKDVLVTGPARDLFEKYSHIPADQVVQHVSDLVRLLLYFEGYLVQLELFPFPKLQEEK